MPLTLVGSLSLSLSGYTYFEGVSVTTVILVPGACGRAPSRTSCHHFRGSGGSRGIHLNVPQSSN